MSDTNIRDVVLTCETIRAVNQMSIISGRSFFNELDAIVTAFSSLHVLAVDLETSKRVANGTDELGKLLLKALVNELDGEK